MVTQLRRSKLAWVTTQAMGLCSSVAVVCLLGGCEPYPPGKAPVSPQAGLRAKVKLKKGITLNYEPRNAQELTALQTDLVLLVKNQSITIEEARSFIRQYKRRLGLSNPERTNGFDALLGREGLQ